MSTAPRILIVEDAPELRETLAEQLRAQGYAVRTARTCADADRALEEAQVELVPLDVMLPGEDGYHYCQRLRARPHAPRVMMLTARDLEDDLVRGFEAGAQDYVVKPYRLRELLARVKALLARGVPTPTDRYLFGEYTLEVPRRALVRTEGGTEVALTRTEFDLLLYFVRNPERALPRDELLDAVWGRDVVVDPRTVDNFVSSLKKKLGGPARCGFSLHTLRGVGYRWERLTTSKAPLRE